MAQPSPADELFVHQIPELLPNVQTRSPFWRESYFFDVHSPDGLGDVFFFTMALFPARGHMDSIQMGRIGGERALGVLQRVTDRDPQTTDVGGARIEVVRPFEELRLFADPAAAVIGLDLTFRARTRPYGLRRGTMRTDDAVIWDQSHILQSGVYQGTYTFNEIVHEVDGWVGQRDHSWGVRDHDRCPLWLWFQLQFGDGFLGVWHWEFENGARVYSDGCWAGTDGGDPIPLIDFHHELCWIGVDGKPATYGEHGDEVVGLRGACVFTLEGGRRIVVEAEGSFDRPYEPFHRGGLSQMRVRADDGREGTAIYEITGARHHRYFPDTVVSAALPS
ncbi:MAG TPA: hypothetical protein VLD86_06465 [Ilumatobacteraceae bacterium]|nr:hypothetical protein [Ilumatobacteraceae bacterium]